MREEEFNQIQGVVDRLAKDANADAAFVVNKHGKLAGASGDVENLDTVSLTSLTAGNIAARGSMANLLRENEYATCFHEAERANIHIQLIAGRAILVVVFDSKSSLGLVRLRARKASEELNLIFSQSSENTQSSEDDSFFAEFSDEDLNNMFND